MMGTLCEPQTRKAQPKGEAKGTIVPIRFTKAEVERLSEAARPKETHYRNANGISEKSRGV